jgi:hypothetical protein
MKTVLEARNVNKYFKKTSPILRSEKHLFQNRKESGLFPSWGNRVAKKLRHCIFNLELTPVM